VQANLRSRLAISTFVTSSNGLASGNNVFEAILSGLTELVERDAIAMFRAEGNRETYDPAIDVDQLSAHFGEPFHSLREQIEAFFHTRLRDTSLSAVPDEQIYAQMPIALQIEVSQYTNRSLVGEAPLFKGCSDGFVDRLSSLLRERTVEPETVLFRTSDVCRELFVIESGAVEVFDEGGEDDALGGGGIELVSAGETLGDLPFVFGMRHVNNARSTHEGRLTSLLESLIANF